MFRTVMAAIAIFALTFLGANVIMDNMADGAKESKGIAKTELPKAPGPRNARIWSQNGHFRTHARVDGRQAAFIVDTGASHVTLRESDAARLGYRPRRQDYGVRINTANGVGRAARIELDRVEIGDITVRDVTALVMADRALPVNLLGMSFLSRVKWTQDRGQLVLEQ